MSEVLSFVRQFICFLLLASFLTQLVEKKYRKYAALLLGVCIILQIFTPLHALITQIRRDGFGSLWKEEYQEVMVPDVMYSDSFEQLLQEQMLTGAVESEIEKQVASCLKKEGYDLLAVQLTKNEKLGRYLLLVAVKGRTENTGKDKSERDTYAAAGDLDEIKVTLQDISVQVSQEFSKTGDSLANNSLEEGLLRQKLGLYLGMEEEDIHVVIEG